MLTARWRRHSAKIFHMLWLSGALLSSNATHTTGKVKAVSCKAVWFTPVSMHCGDSDCREAPLFPTHAPHVHSTIEGYSTAAHMCCAAHHHLANILQTITFGSV
jgi:hypothetical protein